MSFYANEIMEPEELAQLGAIFDEAWAVASASLGDDAEHRMNLAIILMQLAKLRQLGPHQMKITALRIMSPTCPESPLEEREASPDADAGAPHVEPVGRGLALSSESGRDGAHGL
jgi:hypothetical protein